MTPLELTSRLSRIFQVGDLRSGQFRDPHHYQSVGKCLNASSFKSNDLFFVFSILNLHPF